MKSFNVLSLVSLCMLSQAWPLLSSHHEKRNPNALPAPIPQSYSVVPVDGGSTTNNAQSPKTVTSVSTQTQVQTVISTITTGSSERVTTVVNTILVPITITEAAGTKTVVVAPSITSVPFDDGKWHTTYYYRSTLTDVLIPVSTESSSSLSASTSAQINAAAISPSTITSTAQISSAATTASTSASTTTDWAHYYGTWQETPKNGSWWVKGSGSARL